MSEFLTYSKFLTANDPAWFVDLLSRHNIPYELHHEVNQLDNIYIGESLDPMFILKIEKSNFIQLSALLWDEAIKDFREENFYHYFQTYDDFELREILQHPNDWNAYDRQVAKSLLEKRGEKYPGHISNVDYLSAYYPEAIQGQWIVLGYLLSLTTIGGIFFGLSIIQAKKALQNGELVPIFDRATIRHGNNMFMIGTIILILYIFSTFRWIFLLSFLTFYF